MDQYLNQFHTLLQHSTSLLHGGDGADWKTYIINTACPSVSSSNVDGDGDDNGGNINAKGVGDDEVMAEGESDSDDDMMMLGGCFSDSDSDDDEDEMAAAPTSTSAGTNPKDTTFANLDLGSNEVNEEEDSLLLKRAASVHSALLLCMPQPSNQGGINGRDLVEQLVGAILTRDDNTQKGEEGDDSSLQELISILSFCISSSSLDSAPKSVPQERWKKVCLTNALLAIQFLLDLMKQQQQLGEDALMSSSALDEWNVVILPLLFGGKQCESSISLFLMNDSLRNALLNLSSTSSFSNTSASNSNIGSEATVALCLEALHNATFSTSMPTSALRQKNIIVVCQVLVNLLDNLTNSSNITQNDVDIVREGLHKAVLMILRGICYESSASSSSKPLLNLESLRGVTGMLLPKLYPEDEEGNKNKKKGGNGSAGLVADKHAVELWNEILLLLTPYSEKDIEEEETAQVGDMGKRRCCKNWNYVAPMAATSLLCILLPTFRKMELPSGTNDNSACRPIFQPSIWALIRNCLARTGDSDTGGGRGTSLLARGDDSNEDGFGDSMGQYDAASMDQLLRRRSAHALRLLVEYEREQLLRAGGGGGRKGKKKGKGGESSDNNAQKQQHDQRRQVDLWMKYILCFEMLEMEIELHLVEQVWETVKEMASEAVAKTDSSVTQLPRLAWDDIGSLLCRVLLSEAPTMRKLGLYRFLSGHAGVDVTVPSAKPAQDEDDAKVSMKQKESKGKIKNKSGGAVTLIEAAPLSVVSVSFVLDVVVKSYDSLLGTKIGGNLQVDVDGVQESVSIAELVDNFLQSYTIALAASEEGSAQVSEFVNTIFGPEIIQTKKTKTLLLVYNSVASALEKITVGSLIHMEAENVQATIRAIRAMFASGGAPKSMQDRLMLDLALVLKNSMPWEKVDSSLVLQVLALYPPTEEVITEEGKEEDGSQSLARDAIGKWLNGLGGGKWAKNAASACASAFVLGQLLPFGEMDIMSGVNTAEREMGMAICIMCSLSGDGSELLWPAVYKGLQTVPTTGFCKANRSMILLEFGCKEGVLSGMGNGDLVVDSNQYMMPPPPGIESILGNAVQFILSQLVSMSTKLFETHDGSGASSGSIRSATTSRTSSFIAILIGQLQVLHLSFPSSGALSQAVDKMLEECVNSLHNNPADESSAHDVKNLTLTFAALSCGANFAGNDMVNHLISTCHTILGLALSIPAGVKKDAKQTCRSIFQYAKWGSLSLILPKLTAEAGKVQHKKEVEAVFKAILDSARESVDATPIIALPPLFECALGAGKFISDKLQTVIETLFNVLSENTASSKWSYMLNEMCRLIFSGKLLLEEYKSSCSGGITPIKTAFEKLLKIGGTTKPHICKTVVSRISVAWMGPPDSQQKDVGLCAIPYRSAIIDLLIFKELKFDDASAHLSSSTEKWDALPEATDGSSITRAFVLSFISKLPSSDDMSDVVLKELVHYVLMKLLGICCARPAKGKVFITGSEEYARYTRSFQAICLMSRFVTSDIAQDVASKVYPAMAYNLHGELRYFIEVFVIQCTRRHPSVFGEMFIQEIRKTDLTLQQVSSLMIIGGNMTVGRYSNEFFCSPTDPRMKEILCGALPWLSSTQGFSRAIAQLLCHKLIPKVVDVTIKDSTVGQEKDDAILRSVYSVLDENPDMIRLRDKQQLFFDTYDVDTACTFEGLLSIPVDDGDEAAPGHMIDAIKNCLVEVYEEMHGHTPMWQQMKDLLVEASEIDQSDIPDDASEDIQDEELVNFQRKILPIDALDLGVRSFQEQKQFNAAGKKKQNLIVCASLVDKVPNLAGLARTCEIFSASCLVMPNILVRKQDDFKAISASANDWIELEECKEDKLLSWLHQKKAEGYTIVGLEQTASSKCLTKVAFPEKTVLLLGKEKEGIPIEFLSAVDQCIEIPQLGIIRSLNVHVSGAITIWEYTKQMMERK